MRSLVVIHNTQPRVKRQLREVRVQTCRYSVLVFEVTDPEIGVRARAEEKAGKKLPATAAAVCGRTGSFWKGKVNYV